MPLVTTGMPVCSTKRSAASSAPSAQTSVPSTRTGREAAASSAATLPQRVGVGLQARPRHRHRTVDGRLVEELVHGHVEKGRPAVRGAGQRERLVHGARDLGDLVHGARQLGDGLEQRRVVELLEAAHAPAVGRGPAAHHDEGRAAEPRLGDRADAVGHPGAGRQHREPGHARQLADGLRREHRGLLVPHVEDPHRRVGVHGSVVHREDVRAGQREHRLDAVRGRDRDGVLAAVPLLGTRPGVGRGRGGLGDVAHTGEVTGW